MLRRRRGQRDREVAGGSNIRKDFTWEEKDDDEEMIRGLDAVNHEDQREEEEEVWGNQAEHTEEEDEDEEEDLESYIESLVMKLRLSVRAQRALLMQFQKGTMRDKLSLVADLEEEVKKRTRFSSSNKERERVSSMNERSKSLEQQKTHYFHRESGSREDHPIGNWREGLIHRDRINVSEVDTAWEKLITSRLPIEKQEVLRKQYYREDDPERKLHMYMEFSSYLRPLTEAGKKYQEMIQNEDEGSVHDPFASLRQAGDDGPETQSWRDSASPFVFIFLATCAIRFFF